jgi:putative NADH-flavin reductase
VIVAIIAAGGRLGQELVNEALARGHTVRAGVRSEGELQPRENLEIILCDATIPNDLRNLFNGAQVVFSAIGHVKGSRDSVQTEATRALIAVMNEMDIRRFVDVTGTGVRFPGDKISLVDRFLNLAVGIIDPPRVKDGIDHMEVLKASSIDWTTIRILKLQNVPARPYSLRLNGPTKWYVGRPEVAKAMLDVAEESTFIQQSPILSRR